MVLPEGCNTEWVVSQLDKFIRITDGKFVSVRGCGQIVGPNRSG